MKTEALSTLALAAGAILLSAGPSVALASSQIQIPAAARVLDMVPIKVSNVYGATTCTVSTVGPGKGTGSIIQVRNGTAKGRVKVPAAPSRYKLKVACGKTAGSASSEPLVVVPKAQPLRAT